MNVGDKVRCLASRGYSFTVGKEYTVRKYEPKCPDVNFTWPAYVEVTDDYGDIVFCHADRFEVCDG